MSALAKRDRSSHRRITCHDIIPTGLEIIADLSFPFEFHFAASTNVLISVTSGDSTRRAGRRENLLTSTSEAVCVAEPVLGLWSSVISLKRFDRLTVIPTSLTPTDLATGVADCGPWFRPSVFHSNILA